MTNYKHSNVIDSEGFYVDFVLVLEMENVTENGASTSEWVIQNYTLKDGESLVDTQRPHARVNADDIGIIKFKWNGTAWIEGATANEIAQWEIENPAYVEEEATMEEIIEQQELIISSLLGE